MQNLTYILHEPFSCNFRFLGGLVGGIMMNDETNTNEKQRKHSSIENPSVAYNYNKYNLESNRIGPGKLGGTPFLAICDASCSGIRILNRFNLRHNFQL